MSIIYILIGLAANVFGWRWDYDYSGRFIFYKGSEGNRLFTDKDGFMHPWKPIVGLAAEIGIGIVGYFLGEMFKSNVQTYPVGALTWMVIGIGIGAVHFLNALSMVKEFKAERIAQIKWRAGLKSRLTGDRAADEAMIAGSLRTLKGRKSQNEYCTQNLQWVRVVAPDAEAAKLALAVQIFDWLQIPETDLKAIWKDLKFHPKGATA